MTRDGCPNLAVGVEHSSLASGGRCGAGRETVRQGRAGSREAAPRARTGLLAAQNERAVGAAVLLAAECRFTTIRNDLSRPSVCACGFV